MLKEVERKAKEINDIEILPDRDYKWVWEYAQFRFKQSISDTGRAQERASELLKLAFYGFGAFWALLVYFLKERNLPLDVAFNLWTLAGLVTLCLSAVLCIYCLLPVRKLLPYGEEVAIRFINQLPQNSPEAQTRFGLGLKMCSDFQEQATTRKSKYVFAGFILLLFSAALLFVGFYSWIHVARSCGHSA